MLKTKTYNVKLPQQCVLLSPSSEQMKASPRSHTVPVWLVLDARPGCLPCWPDQPRPPPQHQSRLPITPSDHGQHRPALANPGLRSDYCNFLSYLNYLSEINSLGCHAELCSKIIKDPSYSAGCLQMKKKKFRFQLF